MFAMGADLSKWIANSHDCVATPPFSILIASPAMPAGQPHEDLPSSHRPENADGWSVHRSVWLPPVFPLPPAAL